MPLKATSKSTSQCIDVTALNGRDIRADFPSDDFICPFCESPMFYRKGHLRNGFWVNQHFVHNEICSYDHHSETVEHILGKEWLKQGLQSTYKSQRGVRIELEVPIDMAWRAKGRIADIMVEFERGWKEIHEVQMSPITVSELAQRTEDYERCGYDVTWWFGPQNNKDQIRDWCYRLFGVFYVIQIQFSNTSNVFIGNNALRGN